MKLMKKIIAAMTLTGLLTMGLGVAVFADDAATASIDPTVTKHLVMAEGLDVPDETFNFTATAVTEDAPEITINNISYNKDDDKGFLSTEGIYVLTRDAGITFGTFPHAGIYEYTVTEEPGNADGITYDATSYTLKVYVANDDNGQLGVQSVIAEVDSDKQDSLSFTNTYSKKAGFTITKKVDGDLADKTKDFTFNITFTKSGTEADDVTYYTGKIGDEDVVCKIGQKTQFMLHDGESLVFDELPVGTRYVVTEEGAADGYIPAVSVIENGIQTVSDNTTADANSLSTSYAGFSNLVGENENKVVFTNTYNNVPITGLIMKNLDYLLLIGLPLLILILPLAVKICRKKHGNR